MKGAMSGPLERDAPPRCWCGETALEGYSPDYLRCSRCASLVVAAPPDRPDQVEDEHSSLYGLEYFDAHAREMGHPPLEDRARLDLPERCAFWLETLLRFRPPPAATLELGCANGAFVALLTEAGYRATGLDLSPAVTAFVHRTFQVPVLTGRLEDQAIPPASLDVVAMMDVLEHLPDPVATLRQVAAALRPDGLLLVQTPRFDPDRTHAQLLAAGDPFLAQLKPREHLFLLSPRSAAALLAEAGFVHLQLVPAIFSQYDMSFVASRTPLVEQPAERGREALRRSRAGRAVEALLDARSLISRLREEQDGLRRAVGELERDRAAQAVQVQALERELERQRGEREMAEREAADAREASTRLRQQVEELAELRAEHLRLVKRLGILAPLFRTQRSGR
jgi:2-polyprenyl-3-methyl-5-hydroxy-6-metoxy-1,4-benzoquinol methylase